MCIIMQIDGHQMKTQFRMRGVRDRGRGRERSMSGVGDHRSGCKEMVGNLLMA